MSTTPETTERKEQTLDVNVTLTVTLAHVSDLLCNAFEGGSNRYEITEQHAPESFEFSSGAAWERIEGATPTVYPHLDYPLNPGGHLLIKVPEGDGYAEINGRTEWALDLGAVKQGLSLLATAQPRHFADFLAESDDATTGDVFLQLCLFGEVVFG